MTAHTPAGDTPAANTPRYDCAATVCPDYCTGISHCQLPRVSFPPPALHHMTSRQESPTNTPRNAEPPESPGPSTLRAAIANAQESPNQAAAAALQAGGVGGAARTAGQKHSPPARYVSPRKIPKKSGLGRSPLAEAKSPGSEPFAPGWWYRNGFGGPKMANRIQLTGFRDSGPVWVYPAHVTAVFVRSTGPVDKREHTTCINVVGGREPIGVRETPEEVFELIDNAAAGLLA